MTNRRDHLAPQPLLLSNREGIRLAPKSATYRSQESYPRKISATHTNNLHERITNELKKIVPEDLGYKSTSRTIGKEKHLQTVSSSDYIKEYQYFNAGANPEITDKLDELAEKINLIEFRQRKMHSHSQSRFVPNREEISIAKHYSRTMKLIPSKSASKNLNLSKSVIKDIQTVKEDIEEIKEMMETITENQLEGKSRPKSTGRKIHRANKPKTAVRREVYPPTERIEIYNQGGEIEPEEHQTEEERRTVYFKKQIDATQKNISLEPGQSPEEIQF